MTVDPAPGSTGAPTGGVLVRSEERLDVSTVRVPARRVRLEKFVVTETRTVTVQVSREEVRIVDVDLSEVSDRAPDPDPGRWLTLSEERVAITTTVVPVQRVRLDVSAVTENQVVTENVRRERVAFTPDSHLPGVATATAAIRPSGDPS